MPDLWPEVFDQPLDMPYPAERNWHLTRGAALYDMLEARKLALSGEPTPDNFAAVMLKLGAIAGCAASEEAIRRTVREWWVERNDDGRADKLDLQYNAGFITHPL